MLILTTFDLEEYVFAALRAGARDSSPKVRRRLIEQFAAHLPPG